MQVCINGSMVRIDDEDYHFLLERTWFVVKYRQKYFYLVNAKKVNKRVVTTPLHRMLLNAPKGVFVDHINGDSLDNRRCNLRLCSLKENTRNHGMYRSNTSGYTGVSFQKRRKKSPWMARIGRVGRTYLGVFKTPEEASDAYERAAKERFGEFNRATKRYKEKSL